MMMKKATPFILAIIVFIFIQVLIQTRVLTPYHQTTLYWICIYAILAVSLNLIVGITGQLSLGHAGFMSIGAYTTALSLKLLPNTMNPYLVFFISLGLGIIFASIVALIVGIPTLRLKGDYLSIATLGVGEIIKVIFLNLKITNGASGLSNIRNLSSWPLFFALSFIAVLIAFNYKNSHYGRSSIAIREDEIAAEAMGIHTTRTKLISFILAGALAAVAGSMYAVTYFNITPRIFDVNTSINILIIVVFGGMGSLSGSLLATLFVAIINFILQPLAEYRTLLYASILILVMIFRPHGLLGDKELTQNIFRRFKKERGTTHETDH